MADSANILSVLSMLAQPGLTDPPGADAPDVQLPGVPQGPPPPQQNVLQSVAPQQAPVALPPPAPEHIAQAAADASPPVPKPRRSLLDTIGRISDVLAKVGGADPLYQPTLDSRQDRTLKLGDHDRQVQADNIKLATDKFDLGDKENLRLGQAARGAKAIIAANPNADPAAVWSAVAERMGISPEKSQAISAGITHDPALIDGIIAGATDPKLQQSKYSGSVVYAKDKSTGQIVAFQPSLDDNGGRNILPDNFEAIEPSKVVDLGGSAAIVGNSGTPKKILPKTAHPDTILTTTTSRANNRDTNQTNITIAGMPARASQAPGKGTGSADMDAANALLDNIQRGFDDLHKLQALPGDGSGAGAVAAAFGRTALGQKVGEQVGNAPAQKRLEIEKDINSLQSEMVKSLPASATRTKFEQEIQRRRMPDPSRMSYATAQQVIADLRRQFAQAQKDAAIELSKKGGGAPKSAPSGGWGTATVVHGG